MSLDIFDGMAATLRTALGEPVTWTPKGGVAIEVHGIVNASEYEDQIDQAPRIVREVIVAFRAADVSGMEKGDEIDVRRSAYIVGSIMDDGEAMISVRLERVEQ